MESKDKIQWPGAFVLSVFLTWLLFVVWTLVGVLPWQ